MGIHRRQANPRCGVIGVVSEMARGELQGHEPGTIWNTETEQRSIDILIAGLGSVGRRHLRNLRTLGCEDVILYRTGHSTLPDDDLAGLPVETDLAAALAHQPRAAIIANPTALHLPVALAAARAGCHLFIEKPVSHSLDGLHSLADVAQEKEARILVGFQYRFHPGLRAIKLLIDGGAIGAIVCAHVHWGEHLPGWHPWEDYRRGYSARADLGGGVILTLCHPFDYLRWLLGEVQAVSAVVGRLSGLELNVEDTADITLQFKSGAIGTVHLDYIQRPPAHWLQITGQTGTIEWDNANGTVRCYQADRGEWETIPVPPGFERNTMFLEEMRHFLECIAKRVEPLITLEDGIRALEIALIAKRSALEGRVMETCDG
jgi:predicted dehydrogenase